MTTITNSHLRPHLKKDEVNNCGLPGEGLRKNYWDQYYANSKKINVPSQFAAFIANEFIDFPLIIDIGCGNGRDTQFFSYLGFNTIGIDGSESAIDYCKENTFNNDNTPKKNTFLQYDIAELYQDDAFIDGIHSTQKIFYSRFFLHAINPAEEECLFQFIKKSSRAGDFICLEFRTSLDENRSKVTDAHYRRYINVDQMLKSIHSLMNLELIYLTEGLGLAKYKLDDAHVCRIVLKVK